jgi:hypothetical protein
MKRSEIDIEKEEKQISRLNTRKSIKQAVSFRDARLISEKNLMLKDG